MWYWKSTTFKGFFKTINWIHRSQLKWNTIKTFQEATALHLPFYEQKFHYTVKPLNFRNTWSEKMNSNSTLREFSFALTATIQIPDYIYIWKFKLEQGSSSKPHPFFGNILNKRLPVSCNVRTVQQNLLLLTRKQFHVIKTNTCALVQKQSDN